MAAKEITRGDIRFRRADKFGNDISRFSESSTRCATLEGRLALKLVEEWGMVVSSPDGEDTSGRRTASVMPPAMVVARACETAELMVAEMNTRGWLLPTPTEGDWEALEGETA